MSKNDQLINKVAGAIYGFAIGDAMGATTEFMTKDQIECIHGVVDNIIGGGWLSLEPGQVTDDTEMMLCVAEGYRASVVHGSDFASEVSKRFVNWYQSGPIDCGNACATGIKRIAYGEGTKYDSSVLGNGALMRALPMAIVDRIGLNLIQGDMTHCNRVQHYFINEYHDMIVRQIYGGNRGKEIGWRPNGLYSNLSEPTGHVANTLYNAVRSIEEHTSFADVIISSVNGGGDADTIAAIAGSLAGAKYGFEYIPTSWVSQLDSGIRRRLDDISSYLAKCCASRYAK